MQDLKASEVAMIAGYVKIHRQGEEPFDVVIGGPIEADVAAYEEAGATWFICGPGPGGESIEETMGWLREGPPRPA
jgi:hypothetical protein